MTITAHKNIQPRLEIPTGHPFLRYSGLIPLIAFLYLNGFRFNYEFTITDTLVWLTCLVVYLIGGVLAGARQKGQWLSYSHLAVMVIWLIQGLESALALILIGGALSLPVYMALQPRSERSSFKIIRHWLNEMLTRSAINGLPLLLAAGLYRLVNGTLPVTNFEIEAFPPLALALIMGIIATHVLSYLIIGQPEQAVLANWQSIFQELLVIFLIVALPIIYYQTGSGVFIIVMSLVLIQAIRYSQIENYRDTLTRRVQELSLLNNIAQSTSANLVLDDVLRNIHRQVNQLVDASVFYIALYDEHQHMLDFKLVMAGDVSVKWSPRKLTEGPVEYVIRHKEPLMVTADNRLQVRELGDLTHSARYLTFVGVPLLAGDKAIGIMTVLSDKSAVAFSPEDIKILQTIASQTGLAVRNALLYSESTRLSHNLAHINQSAQRVLFNPDLQNALQAACETATYITGMGKVAIFLLDAQKRHLVLSYSKGLTEEHEQYYRERPLDIARYHNGPLIVTQARDKPEYAEAAQMGQYHSQVDMPLHSGKFIQGVISIYYDQPLRYPQSELDLLEMLAAQITAMLDNTEVFRVLEQHAFEMAQLVHLSRISNADMELATVGQNIAEILLDIMNIDSIMITLVEEDKRLRVLSSASSDSRPLQYSPYRLAHIPEIEWLFIEYGPDQREYHAQSDALSPEIQQFMTQNAFQSIAILPLIADSDLMGAILMGSRKQRSIASREWQFMETVTNQVATQLKNVQVYEETQQSLKQGMEQIALIEDIAKQVSSSLDFNEIIYHVLEAAVKVTQADIVSLSLLTEGDDFYVIEQYYNDGTSRRRATHQHSEHGVIGEVMRTKQAVVIHDNSQISYYVSDFPGEYHSSLAVPLIKEDVAIGVLNVESRARDFFNDEQASFLKSLAGHAVISIENAHFLEERQYEIDMLTSLRMMALWLASANATNSVAEAIQETAINMMQGQDAALFAYDPDTDRLTQLANFWHEPREESSADYRFAYTASLEAARHDRLELVADTEHYPALDGIVPDHDSAVAAPIQRYNRVQWVLYLTFQDKRILQDRDLNTIELLVSQAAGHLENATLHEQIRAGRDQMRTILDSTRDGMILLDRDVRLVETNVSAQRLLGINLEEHVTEYFPDMLLQSVEDSSETGYSNDEIQKMARILKLQPDIITRRQFQHTSRGQSLHIEEIGAPVVDHHNNIVGRLLVLRDMSEEKELEGYRDELTRLMVHDLRGPLISLISGLNTTGTLVTDHMNEDDIEDSHIVINSMLISARRLSRMVDSLLDIASMENKMMEIHQQVVSVAEIVGNSFNTLANTIEQSEITVEIRVPPTLPPVLCDQDKLERVIINLLDNAVRYTPAQGQILIEATLVKSANAVRICIADSGPGIPPQERTRIFEKFRRVPGQLPKRGHRGTGLGLALVKAVIEAHDSTIRIEDHPLLPGACFTFMLPVA